MSLDAYVIINGITKTKALLATTEAIFTYRLMMQIAGKQEKLIAMTEFEGLRRELGIEGKDEQKKRLRRLKRDRKHTLRMTRRVLKKLRDEVFHNSRVRSFDDDLLAICHRRSARGKRRDRWVLDIAVRPVLDREERPTHVEALDCWREFEGNTPIPAHGDQPRPSAVSKPDRDSLVRTLKDLLYRYPPGR